MTSISENVFIDKLDDMIDKCNNGYHRTIKIKPVDVKSSIDVNFSKDNYKDGPKFKVGNHVRISKYKNIFAKSYVLDWSEEVFVITKVKNIVPWTHVISDFNDEQIVGTFYEKELQKTDQKEFRDEKVINRKAINVKWKSYDKFFKIWIINEWIFSKTKMFRSK